MAATLNVQPSTQLLVSENWDDDFEYQQESNKSARRRHVGATEARKVSITGSGVEDWDADEDLAKVPRPPSATSQAILHQHVEHQTDNWDDDFEDGRNSPKKFVNTSPRRRRDESWDNDMDLGEETDDDSAEFGFAEKEEDRTVTAKSRRAALKRLSSPTNSAPMPPPLPTDFLLNLSQQRAQGGPYPTFQQPFPARSPTSSVFSVPTTIQTHYSSTTHLRPTSAFALLPPSPPIHKERERKRLRKKSRPKPKGTFELASLRGSSMSASELHLGTRPAGPFDSNENRDSLSDDGDAEPSNFEQPRQTPTDNSSADDRRGVTPALTTQPLPQTPSKGSALLSRIGSVKKWGARRKRASTTPSEVIANESNNMDPHRTPRAKSSRASFHANIPSSRKSMTTPPPSQELAPSTSNSTSVINNPSDHLPSQRSNWFFRTSSAGSPHNRAGGRAGGRSSSKGDRGKEEAGRLGEDKFASRQRSESVSRRRSQSRTGRMGSYLSGSGTDLTHARISGPSTPSKLVKRKSIGFIQLKKSIAADKEDDERRTTERDVNDSPRKKRYVGIGLGRTAGRGIDGEACEEDANEPEGVIQHEDEQERRTRRKSFSRFLFDRDRENESAPSTKCEAPEKDGSRGFMGSVRRISLVGGKHKRTKSGNGVLVSIGEGGRAPPLPSSSFLKSRPPSTQLPYLLPLPVTSSQISLRIPSPSTYSLGKQPYSQTGSMHDLPSTLSLPYSRTVSGASSQTQASNTSSVLPMSSISSKSSRNTTGSEQQTPIRPQRKASTRSKASEESARPRKSTSSRRSLDLKITNDVSFVARLSQSGNDESKMTPQQPIPFVIPSPPLVTSSSAPPLLPPIELQPPSPPRTITRGPKPESKLSTSLTTLDSNSTSKLSLSASSSSVFFTPSSSPQRHPLGSASPNSKSSKLHVPLSYNGKSPQLLQSASLGRATTAGSAISESPKDGSGSNGDATHPRRNSLGDLKIPARISQAQVGLRRDLGMVKEFANNVEQLKELQKTYDALVVEVQLILDACVVRHEQQQVQQTSPIPAFLDDTTSFIPLKSKKRPRSNTNQSASRSEASPISPITPAQVSYNELASSFYVINSKYRITWECAELLIELGAGSANGNSNENFSSPPASASAPITSQFSSAHGLGSAGTNSGRERAITLAGDESQPPPIVASCSVPSLPNVNSLVSSPSDGPSLPSSMSWRTSSGRHDLSQRQLVLLREMLNNTHAHANVADADGMHANHPADSSIPEKSVVTSRSQTQPRLYAAVNSEWKWGDPKNSTVTLPEDSDRFDNGRRAKRRSGKLGMSGLRDLLRALKRGAIAEESAIPSVAPILPIHSTTSLSTESSVGSRRLRRFRQPSQRRKIRTVPDSSCPTTETAKGRDGETRTTSPYGPSFTAAKPSPRRPSLASVFRMGGKNRPSNTTNNELGSVPRLEPADDEILSPTGGTRGDSSTEEDWDRMDSASDLDTAAKALYIIDGSATVRGGRQWDGRKQSPYLEQDIFASEQSTDRPLITKRSFGASQTSIRCIERQTLENNSLQSGSAQLRPVRLSNVDEHADDLNSDNFPSPLRSVSQTQSSSHALLPKSGAHPKSGSVRSMPAHVASATMSPTADPKPPLAMTPENIKPLLENAKEVQARLGDCIAELRVLVSRGAEHGMKDGVAS